MVDVASSSMAARSSYTGGGSVSVPSVAFGQHGASASAGAGVVIANGLAAVTPSNSVPGDAQIDVHGDDICEALSQLAIGHMQVQKPRLGMVKMCPLLEEVSVRKTFRNQGPSDRFQSDSQRWPISFPHSTFGITGPSTCRDTSSNVRVKFQHAKLEHSNFTFYTFTIRNWNFNFEITT